MYVKVHPYKQVSLMGLSYQKLGPKYFGPLLVIKRIGNVAYQLELPSHVKINHTFHVS